ncbi:AbrB/MazE/SpoVT family DNA-binding domain-containing protein [Aquisphaera insulae]|uniref:AbrB/MazE/SpoVT family DNA-binding domain-containing protein n=1 Tax=Aquisphaera insulae TaxID=2712864 RepID=UPI0013EA92B1|nr:AbrB/MazE/SpoVT family DNA-binding domain-containing protein [Aquisphaera insulae]
MRTRVSSKGQIVLPAEIREQDGIAPGQQFEVERLRAGEYLLRRSPGPGEPGLVGWLRACPAEGWFREIPSGSTDELDGLPRE